MKKIICGGGKSFIFGGAKKRKGNLVFAKTAIVVYAVIAGIVLWQTRGWQAGTASFMGILFLGAIADWLNKSYD